MEKLPQHIFYILITINTTNDKNIGEDNCRSSESEVEETTAKKAEGIPI